MRKRLLIAATIAIVNAVCFVALFYYIQGVADSGADASPAWFSPVWTVVSFPGRYLYMLPALNHPFGFGEHEDLILYSVAGLNGLVWGGVAWAAGKLRRKGAA